MFHNVSPTRFRAVFADARDESDQIREATSGFEHVDGTLYYSTDDERSGFAIRADGELVYVFSLERGRGDAIVAEAIKRGATYLDCFAGYLWTLYARHGFRPCKVVPNWTPGGPDVVYMALNGFESRHGVERVHTPGCRASAVSTPETCTNPWCVAS